MKAPLEVWGQEASSSGLDWSISQIKLKSWNAAVSLSESWMEYFSQPFFMCCLLTVHFLCTFQSTPQIPSSISLFLAPRHILWKLFQSCKNNMKLDVFPSADLEQIFYIGFLSIKINKLALWKTQKESFRNRLILGNLIWVFCTSLSWPNTKKRSWQYFTDISNHPKPLLTAYEFVFRTFVRLIILITKYFLRG